VNAEAVIEILSNLADNARRHAVSCLSLEVQCDRDAVCIRMRDDGPGLPEGQELRVFERFTSLDAHGGTGLGLPIARELARVQGGELTYAEGVFVLRLPNLGVEVPSPMLRPVGGPSTRE
jgi:signal transduction histidine kinase